MTPILAKIFSSGPFSAVRPYLGGGEPSAPAEEAPAPSGDSFHPSENAPVEEKSAPDTDGLQRRGVSMGTQAALAAFPQVVHLLVDPKLHWGDNLSKEMGLPVINLQDKSLDQLASDLHDPKFAEGFILEGFPTDLKDASRLDSMLENVSPDDRRVLSWEMTDDKHQEVLDHYMNQDLLWMVPESADPSSTVEAKENVMSCLHGLPAFR